MIVLKYSKNRFGWKHTREPALVETKKMKKTYYRLLFAIFLTVVLEGTVPAQNGQTEPLKYKMELVSIFEEDKPVQYIFVLNGSVGFKSVASLRAFIGKLQAGTLIEWRKSCVVMGDEPLRTEKEMADFEAFCKSKKVKFILLPSG